MFSAHCTPDAAVLDSLERIPYFISSMFAMRHKISAAPLNGFLLSAYVLLCLAQTLHEALVRHVVSGDSQNVVSCCSEPQPDYCQTCAVDPAAEAYRHAPSKQSIHECPFESWLRAESVPPAPFAATAIADIHVTNSPLCETDISPVLAPLSLAPKQSPPA